MGMVSSVTPKLPRVSIVLAFFNAEPTLGPAILSIINQSYPNWELILLDDGSTDNSLEVARRFEDPRIRIVADGRNLKLARRLNQGVMLSRGDYIARMDADDISYPARIETQLQYLKEHPHIDLVASRVVIFETNGRIVGTYPFREKHADICRRPWAGFYLPHPTWMGKAAWFRINPYNARTLKAQDQELLLRTYDKSRFASVPEILLGYHKNQLSLKNIMIGRYLYSRMLIDKAKRQNKPFFALGIFEQALKFMIEVGAIVSGLNYKVLKHRALPVSDTEMRDWENVWNSCRRESTPMLHKKDEENLTNC
jgi:glycosyltransferase involved in cell wall biosynthesis